MLCAGERLLEKVAMLENLYAPNGELCQEEKSRYLHVVCVFKGFSLGLNTSASMIHPAELSPNHALDE